MICFMVLIFIFIFIVIVVNINFILDVDDESFLRICFFIVVVWGVWYWVKSLFLGFVLLFEGKYWLFLS